MAMVLTMRESLMALVHFYGCGGLYREACLRRISAWERGNMFTCSGERQDQIERDERNRRERGTEKAKEVPRLQSSQERLPLAM